MKSPSFDEVAAFVREFAGISPHRSIKPETRLEADLGITGDDGDDLLRAANEHFQVDLASPDNGIAQTFRLGPNEYFFHPEGFDLFGISLIIRWFRRQPAPAYRDLTAGELHKAISEAPALRSDRAA